MSSSKNTQFHYLPTMLFHCFVQAFLVVRVTTPFCIILYDPQGTCQSQCQKRKIFNFDVKTALLFTFLYKPFWWSKTFKINRSIKSTKCHRKSLILMLNNVALSLCHTSLFWWSKAIKLFYNVFLTHKENQKQKVPIPMFGNLIFSRFNSPLLMTKSQKAFLNIFLHTRSIHSIKYSKFLQSNLNQLSFFPFLWLKTWKLLKWYFWQGKIALQCDEKILNPLLNNY